MKKAAAAPFRSQTRCWFCHRWRAVERADGGGRANHDQRQVSPGIRRLPHGQYAVRRIPQRREGFVSGESSVQLLACKSFNCTILLAYVHRYIHTYTYINVCLCQRETISDNNNPSEMVAMVSRIPTNVFSRSYNLWRNVAGRLRGAPRAPQPEAWALGADRHRVLGQRVCRRWDPWSVHKTHL